MKPDSLQVNIRRHRSSSGTSAGRHACPEKQIRARRTDMRRDTSVLMWLSEICSGRS